MDRLALQLISDLCGEDEKKWREVEETYQFLNYRKKLWDMILEKL